MTGFSENFAERRKRNAATLVSLGTSTRVSEDGSYYKTVREGNGPTIYTIGYEKRDGDELISRLRDAGVDVLIDVRDKPISRKPDFRESALRVLCEHSHIRYESRKDLGSTEEQRGRLKESGDFKYFAKEFRAFAKRQQASAITILADRIKKRKETLALVCYERCHDECHRSVLAELLAEKIDCTIIAIL